MLITLKSTVSVLILFMLTDCSIVAVKEAECSLIASSTKLHSTIVESVTAKCAAKLEGAKSIPRVYRKTGKEVIVPHQHYRAI